VALRAVDPPLRGRTEAGGIALDLQDAADVRRVYERIDRQVGGLRAAVVQAMAPPGVEVRIALDGTGPYGPMVHVGLGGMYAEAIDDAAPVALPLDERSASDAVAACRAGRALGAAAVDPGPCVDLLRRVGALEEAAWELERIDLNPVLVGAEGAWVLDGRASLAPSARLDIGDVRSL
jgi:hypothetical protein